MRIAFAVFAGYLVMTAILICTSFAVVFGVGERHQFREGTLDPAPTVFVAMSAAACLAGLLGGWLTAKTAQANWRVARAWLIGVILVLGTFSVLGDWMRAQSHARNAHSTEEIARMSLREKLENATKPIWFSAVVPLIGVAAAAAGCRWGAAAPARIPAT